MSTPLTTKHSEDITNKGGGGVSAGGGILLQSSAATSNTGGITTTNSGADIINSHIVHNKYHKRPIRSWARGIIIRQACHSKLATKYTRIDNWLNLISVTLTALSSSAVFATINPSIDMTLDGIPNSKNYLSWGAGLVAVTSTILQAIVKAMNFATLAEQHRMATRQLTKLRFRLELVVGDNFVDDGKLKMEKLAEWTREYEDLLDSAPIIPQDLFAEQRTLELETELEWQKVQNDVEKKIEAEEIALRASQMSKINFEDKSIDGDEELGTSSPKQTLSAAELGYSPKKSSVAEPHSASKNDDFPFTILSGYPNLKEADDTGDDSTSMKENKKLGAFGDEEPNEKTSLIQH